MQYSEPAGTHWQSDSAGSVSVKTTAEAERIHASGHLKALEAVGSTLENLQTAIDGETYEYSTLSRATAPSEGRDSDWWRRTW